MLRVAIVDQRVQPIHRAGIDMPTTAAIAAIGAAIFDETLAPEGHDAVTAIAALHIDLGFIEKFHVHAPSR